MDQDGKGVRASERIETARLVLRRPRQNDAQDIFHRYASDRDVTQYLSWPTHRSVADTLAFIAMSDEEWLRWPAGPYLVMARVNGNAEELVGSTGLLYKSAMRAITGYVFARSAWGQGYATEALEAMVNLARQTGVRRLEAICHVEHTPSAHVLENAASLAKKCAANTSCFPIFAHKTEATCLATCSFFSVVLPGSSLAIAFATFPRHL